MARTPHLRPVDPLGPASVGALHAAAEKAAMTLRGLSTLVLAFELAPQPWTPDERSDVAATIIQSLHTVAGRLDAATTSAA